MKNFVLYTIVCLMSGFLSSCKMELTPYNDPVNRVAITDVSTVNYSFAYYPSDVQESVVEMRVTAIGFLSDQSRTVSVRQSNNGPDAAIAGVHYQLASTFDIPANETSVTIPVTLLRDESLQSDTYTLELTLVANNDFQLGYPDKLSKTIVIADILLAPPQWGAAANYYLGPWGKEKHKLMIEAGADFGEMIDPLWIGRVINGSDSGLITTWRNIFKAKLVAVNAALGEAGPLKEANGTIVVLP